MNEPIHIISLGAGVQSSCMALMAARGDLKIKVDFCVFADTGGEPDDVYDWLETLKKLLPFKIVMVKSHYGPLHDNLFKWGFSQIPCFSKNRKTGEPGKGKRQCTRYWKIRPVNRGIRIETRTFRKAVSNESFHVLKGISTDEISRAKDSQEACQKAVFPLIDAGFSRADCIDWLKKNGFPSVPKSACFFCPLKDQESWIRISKDRKLWPRLIEIDRQLNERGEYIHPSCKPMESKPFMNENEEQLNLWNNECEGMCGV